MKQEHKQQNIDQNNINSIYDVHRITRNMPIDDLRNFIFGKLQLGQYYLIKQVKGAQSDSIDSQE